MAEPHASELRELVLRGAGSRDIHGASRSVGFAERTPASDAFVARELARVEMHSLGTCKLLEAFAGHAPRILDVGCSTGGGTVAMALSPALSPALVVGVDPEPLSLRAAEVRARGYGLDPRHVSFAESPAGGALPFASNSFDLVACVSVLEFIPTRAGRRHMAHELKRVTRPGGYVFITTPSPFRLRELHSKRWLGHVFQREVYPWATPPWTMGALFADFDRIPVGAWVTSRMLDRVGVPPRALPRSVAGALSWASAWQRVLVRKPT
ncbi:MAG: methyltransferase domain-containing protein [Polyangiaceae bacterium]